MKPRWLAQIGLFVLCTLFLMLGWPCQAMPEELPGTARLTAELADSIGRSIDLVPIASIWRYHPGDNPAWSAPGFDDSSWEITTITLAPDSMPSSGWTGIGWFRLRLVIDSSLVGVPIAYRLAQMGAAELYVNGQLVV